MPNLISLKIDVKKLDKSRFFQGKPDKDGHAPLYADIILIPRKEVGKFGDTHIVKQSKKKDEQVELPIIGSATERGEQQSRPAQSTSRRTEPSEREMANQSDSTEDVPF
jgi:hypothetical protein